MERDISCLEEDKNINVSTQVTVEISQDKEVEFSEKFNIELPNMRGQCLNTKEFKLVKNKLCAEIENSLNPTRVINNFLDAYSDIINGSQQKQLVEIINSS